MIYLRSSCFIWSQLSDIVWRKLPEIHQHGGLNLDRPPDNVFWMQIQCIACTRRTMSFYPPTSTGIFLHLPNPSQASCILVRDQSHCHIHASCMNLDSHCKIAEMTIKLHRKHFTIMIIMHMSYILQATHGTHSSSRPSGFNWHLGAGESSCPFMHKHKTEEKGKGKKRSMEVVWLKPMLWVSGVSLVLIRRHVMKTRDVAVTLYMTTDNVKSFGGI